eukprot:scaffold34489_cov14-Tisochrysis_lutea.AAC.1
MDGWRQLGNSKSSSSRHRKRGAAEGSSRGRQRKRGTPGSQDLRLHLLLGHLLVLATTGWDYFCRMWNTHSEGLLQLLTAPPTPLPH